MHNAGFKHTRLFLKDNILFDIPSDSFNPSRVTHWHNEILKLVEDRQDWFLISIPDSNMGITKAATDNLLKAYIDFKNKSCAGIGILVNTVSAKILVNALSFEHLEEFVMIDESIENLFSRIEKRLGDDTALNDNF